MRPGSRSWSGPRVIAETHREWDKDCLTACAEAAEAHGATPYTCLQFYQIDPDGRELHVDMPRLLKIYRDAGYDGYLMVKWHGSEDPYRAVGAITR